MDCNPDQLHLPPFPPLTWDECEWWDGTIDFAFGSQVGLTVTPYDPSVTRQPSDIQREALSFHLEHGGKVMAAVLSTLRTYYDEIRPRYVEYLAGEVDSLMPFQPSPARLMELVRLQHVHVHPWTKDRIGYVGLQFKCSWDPEHGLGVLMHRDRVVSIGGADVSFAWSPGEADNEEM